VISNAVEWCRTDLPTREVPTLLRYETGDFYHGQGYRGPLENKA
jgi:hypothetical protein